MPLHPSRRFSSFRRPRRSAPLSIWRRIGTILAGTVGALAFVVSAYGGVYVQHEQVRAATWPCLQWADEIHPGHFVYTLDNVGVGPAEIQDVHVTVDGKPATTWNDWARLVVEASTPAGAGSVTVTINFVYSFIHNRVVGAAAHIDALTVAKENALLAEGFAKLTEADRIRVDICYCSVLDECWLLVSTSENRAVPLKRCPARDERSFRE